MPDWSGTGYVRIYQSIRNDPKFRGVLDDPARLGVYVRLLMDAELAYPNPASLPPGSSCPPAVLDWLVRRRIVRRVGESMFVIAALAIEREQRRAGGLKRSEAAERDGRGRFSPAGHQVLPAGLQLVPAKNENENERRTNELKKK